MTTSWLPTYGHPHGAWPFPAFIVDDGFVYVVAETPARASGPWFSISGRFAFPSSGHPEGESALPWFEISGSMVCPASGHPDGPASRPWYRAVPQEFSRAS